MYQLYPQKDAKGDAWGCDGPRCITCAGAGMASETSIASSQPTKGITITLGGGEGGRTAVYDLICDTTVPLDNPPEPVLSSTTAGGYTVQWRHPAACGTQVVRSQCNYKPVTKPTKAQLAWQAKELVSHDIAVVYNCVQLSLPSR